MSFAACKNAEEPPIGGDPPSSDQTHLPGNGVGNLAYGADIPLLLGEGSFNVSQNRGKVTVLNFWGTWCPPCRDELPAFDRIASEYAETVTVFAVHTYPAPNDTYEPVSYVNERFADSKIIFGVNPEGNPFYTLYGGDGYYPFTVIVDAEGVITYRKSGGLSYEQLKALVDAALK
jgi:thiol-disulfide isomerase/thioredoxin